MKSFKYVFFLLVSGLISGCSSENEVAENLSPDFPLNPNLEWVSARLADISVAEGDDTGGITTRGADEVDPTTKNPMGKLPDIDMYIAFYDGDKLRNECIKLDKENGYGFVYSIEDKDKDGNMLPDDEVKVYFVNATNKEQCVEMNLSDFPQSRFIFTSFDPSKGTEFTLERMKDEDNIYSKPDKDGNALFPNAYWEYHDKLFSSDGMIFEKEGASYVVKSIGNQSSNAHPVKVWEDVKLSRMTACITLSTVIVEGFDGQNPVNIKGMDKTTTAAEAIKITDDRLHELGYPENLSVIDIFTHKKGLQNFPIHYDFIDGVRASLGDERGNVYLCNLDYPAWMEEISDYQYGDGDKHIMYGVSSQCDNYPFFPSTNFSNVENINLLLFMGFRDRDAVEKPKQQTVLGYKIPINKLTLQYNRNHYLYVALTLQDIMDMYEKYVAEDTGNVETRSGAGEKINQLPSRQLIIK